MAALLHGLSRAERLAVPSDAEMAVNSFEEAINAYGVAFGSVRSPTWKSAASAMAARAEFARSVPLKRMAKHCRW